MNLLFGWLIKGKMEVSVLDHIIMILEFGITLFLLLFFTFIYFKIKKFFNKGKKI